MYAGWVPGNPMSGKTTTMKWIERTLLVLSPIGLGVQFYGLWSYDHLCALIMLGAWAVVGLVVLVTIKLFDNAMDAF